MQANRDVFTTTRRVHRFAWSACVLALLVASVRTVLGDFTPEGRAARRAEGFGLFAVPRLVLANNRFQCTLSNIGNICAISELGDGGVFPTGTNDSYIFNSGFQLAGIATDEAGPWAGDTVSAMFAEFAGGREDGTQLTNIYDSTNPDDLAEWPEEGYIDDPELFAPVLLGRKAASQQDTWVQYWDGDPVRLGLSEHPMGFKVTQRSMSWNFPSGNESVIYFLLEFENVTGDSEFQRLNELKWFGGDDALPDAGWAYEQMYVAVGLDTDVATYNENFATAILPFGMGIAYHGGFEEDTWIYPPSDFYPPFFEKAPGIVAAKYLRSPLDPSTGDEIGFTMMSVYGWPASPFSDPGDSYQVWRYLSGRMDVGLGDPPCVITAEIQTASISTTRRSLCNIEQDSKDIRLFQASGPFTVAPGEASTVAVAYVIAPTVKTLPDGEPSGIVTDPFNSNANLPGIPSFHPGFPSARGCDIAGNACAEVLSAGENAVKAIERGAGWVRYDGPPPAGDLYPPEVEHPSNAIDEWQVTVVPGSLLGRALVAQTVFDNKFLTGFAPEPPAFYLVPGDANVTVVWEPSASETQGDPYYEVTGDPESALYNPNYRQYDVEGYRIWRGTQRGDLDLIAQFDHDETVFPDYTCETVRPEEEVGATDPEGEVVVGFAAGDSCPFGEEPLVRPIDGSLVFNNGSAGGTPGGGVSRSPVALSLDTAVVSDRDVGPTEPLRDRGVPYLYVDTDVTNNFTYFYSVTAFDVNSMASGPLTLRSSKIDQSTVPRADAPELVRANLEMSLRGADGEALDPDAPLPRIDPEAGTFSGPMPPSDAVDLTFAPLLERLLPAFSLTARIDSVVPVFSPGSAFGTPTEDCAGGGDPFQVCLKVHVTVSRDGDESADVVDVYNPWWGAFGEGPLPITAELVEREVDFDPESLDAFGIPSASATARAMGEFNEALNLSSVEGARNRRWATAYVDHGGSRWFDGTSEEIADPARYIRVGHLDAVDTVWSPIAYTSVDSGEPVSCFGGFGCSHFEKQCFERAMGKLGVASDFRVTWENGTIFVQNVTHGTPVGFAPKVRASWGFLTTDANGNGFIDWNDFNYLDPVLETIRDGVGGGECGGAGLGNWVPLGPAVDLVETPSIVPTSTDGIRDEQSFADGLVATGTGFGLYIHGERYIFELGQLPPDGTTWTLRTYSGAVTSDPDFFESTDPRGYAYVKSYTGQGTATRPLLIPGLEISWRVETATAASGPTDLRRVHAVPDPYLGSSQYDLAPTAKRLMFVNLPPRATLRIYTVTGVLVNIVKHEDPSGGGRVVWDLRNRNNQVVASGVYFFHVVTPEGDEHVGKFTVLSQIEG